jgi:pyruvate kinase
VLCLTPSLATARRLALAWGVHCVHTKDVRNVAEMVERACRIAEEEGVAGRGDRLVITGSVPFGTPGTTNLLRIAGIGD